MIPLRDVIPSRTTPVVTLALIALNATVFLYQLALGSDLEAFVARFGLVPDQFSWVSAITSMFLHGGVLHVGGTLLYLWLFGENVEDRMGHGRFLAFYLLCGLTAALAQAYTGAASTLPVVGAGGAIAGVMGAYFVLYPRSRVVTVLPVLVATQVIEVPAIVFLGVWCVLQVLVGVGSLTLSTAGPLGGMAFSAHVAGFAAGAAMVFVFRRPDRLRVEWWHGT